MSNTKIKLCQSKRKICQRGIFSDSKLNNSKLKDFAKKGCENQYRICTVTPETNETAQVRPECSKDPECLAEQREEAAAAPAKLAKGREDAQRRHDENIFNKTWQGKIYNYTAKPLGYVASPVLNVATNVVSSIPSVASNAASNSTNALSSVPSIATTVTNPVSSIPSVTYKSVNDVASNTVNGIGYLGSFVTDPIGITNYGQITEESIDYYTHNPSTICNNYEGIMQRTNNCIENSKCDNYSCAVPLGLKCKGFMSTLKRTNCGKGGKRSHKQKKSKKYKKHTKKSRKHRK
jgi:hypothetical protein